MNINRFKEELLKININVTDKQLSMLEKYYELLVFYNSKMNLTGITEKEDVYLKHFYDSATLNKAIDLSTVGSLCDIGTGAGFPGLVIKILFPSINVTLVDSLGKRIKFLNTVVEELNLKNINIVLARAEEYALKNREKFDVVTSRAVANLSILMEYSVPLVKINGFFIPLKANVEDEMSNINNVLNLLNVDLVKKYDFLLPYENSNRSIIKFIKKSKTQNKFPRKYSDMKKKPL